MWLSILEWRGERGLEGGGAWVVESMIVRFSCFSFCNDFPSTIDIHSCCNITIIITSNDEKIRAKVTNGLQTSCASQVVVGVGGE